MGAVDQGPAPGAGHEPPDAGTLSPYFRGLVLDEHPNLLTESYRLRYEVYCLDRGFLPASDYPDGIESDVFDAHAVHIGVVNLEDEVVATARLVRPSEHGLPMFGHCTLAPEVTTLIETGGVVEVSRLAVSRRYNRRRGDGFYSLAGRTEHVDGVEKRRRGGVIVLTLYQALYQASKRLGFTHWLAATERSLQRLVAGYAFPFRPVGPEVDYFGLVMPYLMDLREFDRIILSGRVPLLRDFLTGLEPEFRPVGEDASSTIVASDDDRSDGRHG